MRVVIVGFPYSGKTTLFMAISGLARDHLKISEENLAAVKVPEPRLDWLEQTYRPKKRTEATMDFVDLPGSTEGESEHAGLTRHLPTLRNADALLVVLRGFQSDAVPLHGGSIDPERDLKLMLDEMLLADLVICDNRIQKLEKAIEKPSKERDQQKHELALLQRCRATLEAERPLSGAIEAGEEAKLVRSFGFLTQKRMVVTINVGERDIAKPPALSDPHAAAMFNVCAPIEADIIQLDPADRPMFMQEYGIQTTARDRIIRACFDALGLIVFLTAGEDEVRAWPIPRGASAVEAAGKIHSDLARGFIRAETIAYDDLHKHGSMRDAKAHNLVRQEPKHYVVQDGDILNIKFAI
jgi:GTP-binding protein YchF